MTHSACLCGNVTWDAAGPFQFMSHCHCSRCRKGRGAAHASNLITGVDGVRFTRGAELVASYKVPEARFFTQDFCRRCGSPVPRLDRERNFAVVPMGTLDDDPGISPQAHIFVGSKAPWYEIADGLPQYEEYPPAA
jgi:hypothetical protein